jgi:hypothetical protein
MTIYLVYENADKTEGRGPMVLAKDSGYFTNEDDAWTFADTLYGVMGRKPNSGSWRTEKYPDVYIKKFEQHDNKKFQEIRNINKQLEELEYRKLELKQMLNNIQ